MNLPWVWLPSFSTTPNGRNPAGVWIGDTLPDGKNMRQIAAEVGYSETAFVAPDFGRNRIVRYCSPEVEVSFCGHATIATGVVPGEAEGDGTYRLVTAVGQVPVSVRMIEGRRESSLTSIEPKHSPAADALVNEALSTLGWTVGELDRWIPPARAYAGAWHLVLVVADAQRLARLDYDLDLLKALMLRESLTTPQLVWRERIDVFQAGCRRKGTGWRTPRSYAVSSRPWHVARYSHSVSSRGPRGRNAG
jgi:PhzF family phenazine biosynthesis protein